LPDLSLHIGTQIYATQTSTLCGTRKTTITKLTKFNDRLMRYMVVISEYNEIIGSLLYNFPWWWNTDLRWRVLKYAVGLFLWHRCECWNGANGEEESWYNQLSRRTRDASECCVISVTKCWVSYKLRVSYFESFKILIITVKQGQWLGTILVPELSSVE
jgi:hypothetical protein